ncbi:MAG: DNA repair protein RecN [Acetatifactor sp.]|nr:DNA repair protein RecN [Acetatifactor sp.]
MLQSLHVKNLALLEETEVEFGEGLNILTGETGAGKSLLIGSINLALGGKFDREMLRAGAESALVEIRFSGDKAVTDKLREMEIEVEPDESVFISRKLQPGKNICRINGESVSARQVKELAELLLDIHGQHEHQSLLHRKKHLEILDAYCGEELTPLLEEAGESYRRMSELSSRIEEETLDEAARRREQDLAEYEWREITESHLQPGEDEELENRFRFMNNSRRILEGLYETGSYTGNDSEQGAGSNLGRALRGIRSIAGFDGRLEELAGQLAEIDSLLADFNRDLEVIKSECEFDEAEYAATEERLNLINRLKGKYGNSIEEVLSAAQNRRERLDKLADYDAYLERLQRDLKAQEQRYAEVCEEITAVRRKNAMELEKELLEALKRLNFLTVSFQIAVEEKQVRTAHGWDEVEFLISTNPGEPIRPISQVASGGELSRIMLAIKTVLAERDSIDTLIFDEIDTGISGRTAWRVSEQLSILAGAHQVICITHLPQIAAMADRHFCIAKSSTEDNTITDISCLSDRDSLAELARLLGSDSFSEAALENAREMKRQADQFKNTVRAGV